MPWDVDASAARARAPATTCHAGSPASVQRPRTSATAGRGRPTVSTKTASSGHPASSASPISFGPSTTNARSVARADRCLARRAMRGLRAASGRCVREPTGRMVGSAPESAGGWERLIGHLHQCGERTGIGDGEVGEDLAIDLDLGELQPVDEAAVAGAVLAARRVDALDPQLAEVALARPAIPVRVLQRVHDLLVGGAVGPALVAVVALGPLEG